MKSVLVDLFTSKKFLAALTAVIVYVAGRFGFDVDTAVLDRIFAAFLVYVGAQGVADVGKGAAQVQEQATAARIASFGAPPAGLESGAVLRQAAPLGALALMLGLAAGSQLACTAAQRTATGPALIDCTAANGAAIGATAASMRSDCVVAGTTSWTCVETHAAAVAVAIGGCAFLEVLAAQPKTSAAAASSTPDPGRAAFERFRSERAGGATFRTAAGDR